MSWIMWEFSLKPKKYLLWIDFSVDTLDVEPFTISNPNIAYTIHSDIYILEKKT